MTGSHEWQTQPPPPRRGLSAVAVTAIVAGGVVLLAGICVSLVLLHTLTPGPRQPGFEVTSCTWDGHLTHLRYKVTNRDSVPHDYWVEAQSGHTPLIPGVLRGVSPGDTATGEIVGGGTANDRCTITRVRQT